MAKGLKYKNDPDIEDIRRGIEEDLNIRHVAEESSIQHSKYSPGASYIIFEGARDEKSIIQFPRYFGDCQAQHKTRRLYVPKLKIPVTQSTDEDGALQIKEMFCTQMDLINLAFNANVHGDLRINARFGCFYVFDDPPASQMTVDEFNKYVQVQGEFERGKKPFRSSFIPRDLSHSRLQDYLEREGYGLFCTESQYIINFNRKAPSRFDYSIALDGDFQFVEVRYPDVRWVAFTVKRSDPDKRDVRLLVQSTRRVKEKDDPATRKYRHADVIKLDGDEVIVQPGFTDECRFVRRKVARKFKRSEGAADQLNAEVDLVRTQENFKPDHKGRFTDRKPWREEVVIQPAVPDLSNKEALNNFPLDFLKYCFNLERVAE